jgi:hypothetical protein
MKISYSLILLLTLSSPAFASATKSDNGVDLKCELTGSGDSGFSIYATNNNSTSMECTASCKLTKSDGTTQQWDYDKPFTIGTNKQRYWLGGEGSIKGAPLKNPDLTKASCKKKS